MERIIYRLTLDTHKNGVQKTLQGFQTADNMARRIVISLVSGGSPYVLPTESVVASMFVNNGEDVNACQIERDTVIYDILPSDTAKEGTVDMQMKLIGVTVNGIKNVIIAPRFALEVTQSNTDESKVVADPQFTVLENALAMAQAVYNQRLIKIEFGDNYVFRAYYADGSIYENDCLSKALMEAIEAGEIAKGYLITMEGHLVKIEGYIKEVEKTMAETNNTLVNINYLVSLAEQLSKEAMKHSCYTEFEVDFQSGELLYTSQAFVFDIDEETGNLVYDNDPSSIKLVGATREEVYDYVNDVMGGILDEVNGEVI